MPLKLLVVIVSYRVAQLTTDCLHSVAEEIGRIAAARVAVYEIGTGDDLAERIYKAIDDNGWAGWCTPNQPKSGFHRPKQRSLADGFKGLQIGSGNGFYRGWLNTGIFGSDGIRTYNRNRCRANVEKPLPFPDSSFDAIYGAEVVEHIPSENAT